MTPPFKSILNSGLNRRQSVTEPENLIKDVRLTMRPRAPERALIVWSPGPDGVDDEGRIVYDPTNGTISGGDLVAFPEGY